MSAEMLQAMPAAGWALLFLLLAIAGYVLVKKDVRLKHIEVTSKRELDNERRLNSQHDIVSLISSQHSNAINLLRKMRVDICEAGREHLRLETEERRLLLEHIAARIAHRIEREVLLDLIRNHFGGKGKEELAAYSKAKAEGYWRRVKTELYGFSPHLPGADLPSIMDYIPVESFCDMFGEIYTSANRIAGEFKPMA